MFKISGSTIMITRGDTGVFKLDILNSNGQNYNYSNDTVVFTVKDSVSSTTALITKSVTYNSNVTILPADTASLDYGTYWYDVQATLQGGAVSTVITPSQFKVMPEVTF